MGSTPGHHEIPSMNDSTRGEVNLLYPAHLHSKLLSVLFECVASNHEMNQTYAHRSYSYALQRCLRLEGGAVNRHLTVSTQSLVGLVGFVAIRAFVDYHRVLWFRARFKRLRIAHSLMPFEARKVLICLTSGWT